ncbi:MULTISPECIES: flagellar biosynthetic protein FliR [Thalassospira]|jgi:flagellar biosynthetic protein FliR|uniref:flagellar biosynthetic protein FliR n=1 Tax=Thalassospira TaxID=168934 RepID=UPI0008DCD0B6|nr:MULTISPECIES: flagellar biosynthetic protein FliR [Thalassospira]MAB33554.1 flagellar biosynthetic protein FliR [Thalassospira sp.]MAZ34335.1 flagellar biosynthetic protein FliR [Thalassospira sp.]MDM7977458.1 flagellar biosynthetic protein FliR [Thalassospira xiamenensis]OHY98128.1 flagellar biosynthetic protein FliR [Thalassospira sp. MIT1004]RCK29690.1 flagellar biosynthesis protein FliR [Thalassospira xiamenensis]|tara:strand:- start:137 stop:901 length:765 start_codon:yes stop_codon:yes gene_type:complete
MDLEGLLTLNVYVVLMSFARVGAAFAFMPGIGARVVPARARLIFAFWVAVVISPLAGPLIPAQPADAPTLFVHLAYELTVGAFFGLFAQVMMAGLQTAGSIIAYSSSMANAFSGDALSGAQSAVTGNFITQIGMVLIFATGLDHLMIQAVFESYSLFPPGGVLPVADMSEFFARAINESFVIAMKISAPFLIVAIVLQVALGLLNKLMPQLPVFFVAMPIQIGLAFILLALALPTMMMVFLEYYETGLESFVNP